LRSQSLADYTIECTNLSSRKPQGILRIKTEKFSIHTDKRKFWWSELSKWDDHVEKKWIQWIELAAGLSAMMVLIWSLLAAWDGKSP
jgi:hypothetical protein